MATNFYMYFLAALIPFILGGIYYGPLLGKTWMQVNGFNMDDLKKGNQAVIFGVSYLFCLMFSLFMSSIVIHQTSLFGLFNPEIMAEGTNAVKEDAIRFFQDYGTRHRSFGHGAAHGLFFSIFIALPILGVIALFERRGFKYILIHFGYWLLTSVLVGGLLCQTLEFPPIG